MTWTPPARRAFLRALAASSTALALRRLWLPGTAHAQTPPPIETQRLADALLLLTGAGCNVLVVTEPDAVTLVDAGRAEHSAALLAAVARETGGRPVRTLVNTHWHSDHTGANEVLGRAGATVVAHANTKRWLGSRVYRELQDRVYPPRPPEALPSRTITRLDTIMAGGTRIQLIPLPPAHTNGDLAVFLPEADVLMTGDVLTVGRYPVMDYSTGGWIGGSIDALAALLAIADARTRIVAGLGPVQSRADLQAARDMLTTVKDRVWEMIRQGKGLSEVRREAPTREFDAAWGANEAFVTSTYVGLVRHTRELGGVL